MRERRSNTLSQRERAWGAGRRYMDLIEILKGWLMGFPGWEGGLDIDATGEKPGSCGLFPLGAQELSRREDVLGNVRRRLRCAFALRRVALHGPEAAEYLLELCRWIGEQPPPKIGENTRIRGEKGTMVKLCQTGTATYEMKIILEYDKEN